MEFARRGRPATAGAGVDDDGRRSPDPTLPHGDSMLVIRDALLSQLQKDRFRQEIILAELGKIECALALRSADAERARPVPFAFNEQISQGRGLEPYIDVDEVHDPKKIDGAHGRVEMESEKPSKEDLIDECLRTSGGNIKAAGQENAAPDECNVQESSETKLPKKTLPSSVKWTCAICQVKATSQGNLLQHFTGQKHRSKVASLVSKNNAKCQKAKETAEKSGNAGKHAEKPHPVWVCRFCQSNCTCKSDLEKHMKGKRHQTNIRALLEECKNMESNYALPETKSDLNNVPQDEEGPAPTWTCNLCQARGTRQSELEHLRGKRHRLNFLLLQVEAKQYLSEWGCGICQAKCNSASQFDDHCKDKEHQRNIKALYEEMGIQRTLYFCKLCNLQCNSKNTLVEHCKGKRHSDKVESLSFCEVCNLQCNSEKMLAHHRTGKKHLAKLNGC